MRPWLPTPSSPILVPEDGQKETACLSRQEVLEWI